MKARTQRTWRLARLNRRLTHTEVQLRIWKRSKRGGNKLPYLIDYFVGLNHRQGRITDDLKPAESILLAPPVEQKQQPKQRPAARPSWAIAANLRRLGMGYPGNPSNRKQGAA